ncbi:MAG: hypothetical protein ABIG89_04250 [Candidatus Woesearchaeota archaeon]
MCKLKLLLFIMLFIIPSIILVCTSVNNVYGDESLLDNYCNISQNYSVSNNTDNCVIRDTNFTIKIIKPSANLSIILPESIYTNIEYTKLFRIDNLLYPEQKIDANVYYSLVSHDNPTFQYNNSFELKEINKYKSSSTGILFIDEPGNYTLCGNIIDYDLSSLSDDFIVCQNITVIDVRKVSCDVSLNLILPRTIYNLSEQLKLNFEVNNNGNNNNNNDFPIIIEYWISDLFGNMIRSKINTTNTNKQFTPKIDDRIGVFLINGLIYPLCNDTNEINNYVSEMIIVVNNNSDSNINIIEENIKSNIDIKLIYNSNKLKFGNDVKAKIEFFKGNTTKNTLNAYIIDQNGKKVSETTTLSIFGKYISQELSLSVRLKDDCEQSNGNKYYLVAEGFGVSAKQSISISCETNGDKTKTKTKAVAEPKSTLKSTKSNEIKEKIDSNILTLNSSNTTISPYQNMNLKSEELIYRQECAVDDINKTMTSKIIFEGKQENIKSKIKYFVGVLLFLNVLVLFFIKV